MSAAPTFHVPEIIRMKRDGQALSAAEIAAVIGGIRDGSVGDAQLAAFAMAVFFRGMSRDERAALTLAMRDSGRVLAWEADAFPGPIVDKHSTGGIGDCVSLILAPMLAAVGAYVPMISGRGLGHTGGTLDKLDSIPGYDTRPDLARLRAAVRRAGCAIIGQTEDLAPADRALYAIRDVTATVESEPLIVASILSKKLAAGLGALVLDVKVGSGAFMADMAAAEALAGALVEVACAAGLPTSALITDMDQPLASSAGNALEVLTAVGVLTGQAAEPRLTEVTLELGAELMQLARMTPDRETGVASLREVLASGAAADRFACMIDALGGPADLLERAHRLLPQAPVERAVHPEGEGRVAAIETRELGLAVIDLGGGRRLASDRIDPAVGLTRLAGLGAEAGPFAPLALVHARDAASADRAAARIRRAYRLGARHGTEGVVRGRVHRSDL